MSLALKSQASCCSNCDKQSALIKKYENLIQLYKKKQEKSNLEVASRLSNGKTTSHTSGMATPMSSCLRILQILTNITRRRYLQFFVTISQRSAKKFVFFNLCNRVSKAAKKRAFLKITQASLRPKQNLCLLLDLTFQETLKKSFHKIKSTIQKSVALQQIIDTIGNQNNARIEAVKVLQETQNVCQKTFGNKMIRRRNMELQLANKKLTLENQFLRQCLQQSSRRQLKENQKKKDSLEMLAEELSEKTDLIQQLQASLRAFEEKYDASGKVLEDDILSLRKEVEHLERVRDRLENDVTKNRELLKNAERNLTAMADQALSLKQENETLKKQAFEFDLQRLKNARLEQELNKLIESLGSKIKRVKLYERELQKNGEDSISNLNDRAINETKLELVLFFINNIGDIEYELRSPHLFDEEQLQLLTTHKIKWLKSEREAVDMLKHIDPIREQGNNIQVRGRNSSIFSMLDSPKDNEERCGGRQQGITMRLLEMQIEKSKQVQKISELKEKLMHIRVIVLNLLKNLELPSTMKAETMRILQVIFDMFEYSEEERDCLFPKKKKIFGFI